MFFTRFFVTLEEFAEYLCIKAVWRIEEKMGYELATVLSSTFCYKLHQRTPDDVPPAVICLIIGCKGNYFFRKSKIYSHLFLSSLLNALKLIAASFVAPARKVRIRLRPITDFYADYSYVSINFTTFAHIIHNRHIIYGKD